MSATLSSDATPLEDSLDGEPGSRRLLSSQYGYPHPGNVIQSDVLLGIDVQQSWRRSWGSVRPLHGERQQSSRGLKADSRTSPFLRKRVGVYDRFCLALYEQVGGVRQLLRGSALSQRGTTSREFMTATPSLHPHLKW